MVVRGLGAKPLIQTKQTEASTQNNASTALKAPPAKEQASAVFQKNASSGFGETGPKGPVEFARGQFLKDVSNTASGVMGSTYTARQKFDALNGLANHIVGSKLSPFMKKQALHQVAGQAAMNLPSAKERLDFQEKFFGQHADAGIQNARPSQESWEINGYTKGEAAKMVYDIYRKDAGFD